MNPARRGLLGLALAAPLAAARAIPAGASPRGLAAVAGRLVPGEALLPLDPAELRVGPAIGHLRVPAQLADDLAPPSAAGLAPWGWNSLENVR